MKLKTLYRCRGGHNMFTMTIKFRIEILNLAITIYRNFIDETEERVFSGSILSRSRVVKQLKHDIEVSGAERSCWQESATWFSGNEEDAQRLAFKLAGELFPELTYDGYDNI